jgi:hypothetical protein
VGISLAIAPLLRLGPWAALSTLVLGDALLPEHIENRLIRLTDDLPAGLSPMGHTFENCQIVGPAHVLFGECHIENSAWIRPQMAIMPSEKVLLPGTIAFYGCQFLRCKFSNITAVGTEDEINALQAIFRQDRHDEKRHAQSGDVALQCALLRVQPFDRDADHEQRQAQPDDQHGRPFQDAQDCEREPCRKHDA